MKRGSRFEWCSSTQATPTHRSESPDLDCISSINPARSPTLPHILKQDRRFTRNKPPINQSINRTNNQSIKQSNKQSIKQSNKQSINQSIDRTITSEPINQSINQSIEKSVSGKIKNVLDGNLLDKQFNEVSELL